MSELRMSVVGRERSVWKLENVSIQINSEKGEEGNQWACESKQPSDRISRNAVGVKVKL